MIDLHLAALALMAAQGLLGAFDTIYHHELTEALPQRAGAARELSIHAVRAIIYAVLFIGLSAWVWQGLWAWVLLGLFGVEIILTLWDFVIEDRTRLLPATERVTHTVLAINGGAFITLLVLTASTWAEQPTGFLWQPQGGLSVFLALCGVGVLASGVRDAFASMALWRRSSIDKPTDEALFPEATKRVLVTGATGFIGQALVRRLLTEGHAVTVLSRQPKQASWSFDGRVRAISSLNELHASESFDVVVNLAGARILGRRWTERRKRELECSRTLTTKLLVDWMRGAAQPPGLFVSASAIGYYGIQSLDASHALTEQDGPQDIFMSTLCQRWEDEAAKASSLGVRVAILRLGLVLGHGGALPMMLAPVRLGVGGRLGSGRQWVSWVHLDDVIRAIGFIWRGSDPAEAPNSSPYTPAGCAVYNVVAPGALSQAEFVRTSATILNRPQGLPMPAWPVRFLLGEQADLLLEGQRVTPRALLESGFRFSFPALQACLENLLQPSGARRTNESKPSPACAPP